jgi:hypothetical protein
MKTNDTNQAYRSVNETIFSPQYGSRSRLQAVCLCLLLGAASACESKSGPGAGGASNANNPPAAALEAEQIVARYRALDNSRSSTMKMRAKIEEADGSTRQILMTMYRALEPDGRKLMLVEVNAPAEERDRSALVAISPRGEVEGTRYVQSSDNFVTTRDVMGEDALFGMTLQELADGQVEKYDVAVRGEEAVGQATAYRMEGRLKPGAESKFPRLVLLISKDNYAALVAEFYDGQNNLARRISIDSMEQIDGHWTRMRWAVDNLARQKKIDFETASAKYDQKVEPSIFTPQHLKKIASR